MDAINTCMDCPACNSPGKDEHHFCDQCGTAFTSQKETDPEVLRLEEDLRIAKANAAERQLERAKIQKLHELFEGAVGRLKVANKELVQAKRALRILQNSNVEKWRKWEKAK